MKRIQHFRMATGIVAPSRAMAPGQGLRQTSENILGGRSRHDGGCARYPSLDVRWDGGERALLELGCSSRKRCRNIPMLQYLLDGRSSKILCTLSTNRFLVRRPDK